MSVLKHREHCNCSKKEGEGKKQRKATRRVGCPHEFNVLVIKKRSKIDLKNAEEMRLMGTVKTLCL